MNPGETALIRFKLNELLSERSFSEGRRIEWREVASKAGIHRTTLSRMLNVRGYNASMNNLDALCRYFGCQVGDLAVYVPDDELNTPVEKSFRGPKPVAGRPGQATVKRSVRKKPAA
jgi:putative transcriptional regulator